jgi:dihydrofolate reductase
VNVYIIAAMSADGYIARSTTELANWTSKEDKKLFMELTKRAGVMIMGRTTYDTIGRPLPGRRTIIYSHRPIDHDGVETTQLAPAELIASLKAQGYTELAICGGSSIYDLFLCAGVVNELYLTVEPVLFGNGVRLVKKAAGQALRLKSQSKLNDNTVLLHYEVIT